MTFDDLPLNPLILKAIAAAGYKTPSKIQEKAIPAVIEGSDIRASAQTGTGKTAAFLLPALNRLAEPSKKKGRGPRLLILAPTRELAMQITTQAQKYSKYLERVTSVCISGGVPYPPQLRQLSRPHDILIATPGRLIDFIERGKIDFSRLEMIVLDEADRMLDMGFVEPVEQIVAKTPKDRQTLLFSATMEGAVLKLSERLLNDPKDIIVHAVKEKHDNIKQIIHFADDMRHKNKLLNHILENTDIEHAIVFTATKRHADQLVDELRDQDIKASALHGDLNQRQRTRTITQFKAGRVKILVATDIAARGIDVQSITHVINFDLPHCVEDYVHRIGRTGRAGAKGTAISFAARRDQVLVKKIEKFTGHNIEITEITGLEPRAKSKAPRPNNKRRRFKPNANRGFRPRSKK